MNTNRSKVYSKEENVALILKLYEVLKLLSTLMASWLSWLERRPVTAEVEGSSPSGVVLIMWDLSSAGRASALQAEGHRFEPYRSHLIITAYAV